MVDSATSAFWVPIVRDVVTVTGSDARKYLHSQLSQNIETMQPGDVRASFVLQPTGKIDALLRVSCAANDRFVLDTEAGYGESMVVRLKRFKIRVNADLDLQQQTWRAIRNCGGTAIEGSLAAWRADGTAVDVFSPALTLPPNIPQGTTEQFTAARVAAMWPIMGADISTDMIPAETGIVECAVSFTKGCYPGQELVERMDSRGSTAPKMLMRIECPIDAVTGAEVVINGATVGTYTTVAGAQAIALIKRGSVLD
jgi:folate-binding protein YgfZ